MKKSLFVLAFGLAFSTLAQSDTLELPSGARVDVQVVDSVTLDRSSPTRGDILLRPAVSSDGYHTLPSYCLITAEARLADERVRISTQHLTCIETEGELSEIYSGELSATAQETDGSVGVSACTDDAGSQCERAELYPDHVFQLELGRKLELDPQENPSAEINERRRSANGEGVANPIPAERPDPDSD